jgi:hypothetical protein
VEHFRGQILGGVPIADSMHGVRIHPFEMPLVEVGEARRVPLRRLHQLALVRIRHS